MYGYSYKTTNLITGLIYVGKCKSKQFKGKGYLGSGKIIKQSVRKEGKENFTIELLDTADSYEELNEKEIYWIAKLNARDRNVGYNIHIGGNGGENHEPHIQTEEEKQKRSESLKKAYRENRHRKVSNKGIKLRKRTAEERAANSLRQQNKIWIHNDELNRETTLFSSDNLDDYLKNGWKLGRIESDKDAWNKDKTKETDIRLLNVSNNRKEKFQEIGCIGCYGLKGSENMNYKSDQYVVENIINKHFKEIWELYGKDATRNHFHIGFSVFDRCMKMCNLEESKEHRSYIKKNKKGKSKIDIENEINTLFNK